jgi:hypothetical protein
MFGSATSSNIKSISRLVYKETTMNIEGEYKMANLISKKLIDIKTGQIDHPWVSPIV